MGLGLGLAICHELVERQGGRIWVESSPGEGARFHFVLPVFALEELVKPALMDEGQLRTSYSLVRIEVGGTAAEGNGDRVSLRWLRGGLRQLVYYPTDVLLPQCQSDSVFLVASTDASGMKVLLERIRGHFARPQAGQPNGATVRVRGWTEAISSADRQLPLEQGLDAIARRIEARMRDPQAWTAH